MEKTIDPSTAEEVTRIVEEQLASGNYRHVACNLCGSDDAVPYALRLGAGTPFVVHRRRVVRCRKCGLVYNDPQATEEMLMDYYEVVYNDTLAGLVSRMEKLTTQYRSFWKNLSNRVESGRFLDVGCNTGHLLSVGQDFGWEVYGVDLSTIAIRYGQEKLGLKDLQLSDLFGACYPDNFFDYVHLWHTLEHVRNPIALLKEIYRILKPRKELLVGVPCITDPIYYTLRFKNKLTGHPPPISSDNAHTFEFTPSTLKMMLEKTGFDVQHSRMYYNELESMLPEGGWRGKGLVMFFWYMAKVFPNRFGHRIEAHAIKAEGRPA